MQASSKALPFLAACAALTLSGCLTTQGTSGPVASQSSTPAKSQAKAVPPGMNEKGEVIDPAKVEAGSGRTVKGIGDWEGEIIGIPAPNSKFNKLQIGMSMKQVTDLIGQPTDSGAYMTGKAWIPFYFGSDRHRYEFTYKGIGRLVFAGGSIGNFTGGNLTRIVHSVHETGYRD